MCTLASQWTSRKVDLANFWCLIQMSTEYIKSFITNGTICQTKMNEGFAFCQTLWKRKSVCDWLQQFHSTWARIVKSLRRNGRPSNSSKMSSVVIKRLSLICVQSFESNSFDWNKGGRFDADEARFNVRRSATFKRKCNLIEISILTDLQQN